MKAVCFGGAGLSSGELAARGIESGEHEEPWLVGGASDRPMTKERFG